MPLFRRGPQTVFFVHIPKTGGTSVEETFKSEGWIEALRMKDALGYLPATPQHLQADLYTKLVPAQFYDYAFTVVRNPFARLASEYRMRKEEGSWSGGFGEWLDLRLREYAENPYVADNHLRPQVEFLVPDLQVFRFEDGIANILAKVFARLSMRDAPGAMHLRRGTAAVIESARSCVDRVAEFYARDFAELNYDAADFARWFRISPNAQ